MLYVIAAKLSLENAWCLSEPISFCVDGRVQPENDGPDAVALLLTELLKEAGI